MIKNSIVAIAALAVAYYFWGSRSNNGAISQSTSSEHQVVRLYDADNGIGTSFMRTDVDGHELRMLIDTGAALPVISRDMAEKIGVAFDAPTTIVDLEGVTRELRKTKPVSIHPIGVEFLTIQSEVLIVDQDFEGRGIDGILPPQVYAAKSCGVYIFPQDYAVFGPLGCPKSQDGWVRSRIEFTEILNSSNRLSVNGIGPSGTAGKFVLDTGSEVSFFQGSNSNAIEDSIECSSVTTLSGTSCLTQTDSVSLTIGGKELVSTRAFQVQNEAVFEEIAGIVGMDALEQSVIGISADGSSYLMVQLEPNH